MRCLGLDAERRRCTKEVGEANDTTLHLPRKTSAVYNDAPSRTAVGMGLVRDGALEASEYCAEHRDWLARVMGYGAPVSAPRHGTLGALWARLRGEPAAPLIPDGAHYEVPSWLRNSSTPELIEHLLHHSDSMVRWMAAFTLRKRRAREAIEPLWDVLQSEAVRLVRQQVTVALGKIGTPAVVAPLVEALNHDPDQGVRQAAVIALGNLGYPGVVPEIVRVLEREDNVFVRWDCIVALGQLGDMQVDALLAQLEYEEVAEVVRHACSAARLEIRQRQGKPGRAPTSGG